MRIVVCVKQVLSGTNVSVNPETNTLIRTGAQLKINPSDLKALECALQIKDQQDCEIIAVTMGPKSAEVIIRYCFSLGIDQGYVLSDHKFAGADVYATSYTLSLAMKFLKPDLIICGKESIDGDTGQVGPSLACHLGFEHIVNVKKINSLDQNCIIVENQYNDVNCQTKTNLPAVLIVDKDSYITRFPNLKLRLKARSLPVTFLSSLDFVSFDPTRAGLNGSPTRVISIYLPEMKDTGKVIEGDLNVKSKFLIDIIKEHQNE